MKFNLAPDFQDRVKQYKCYSTVTYKVLLNRPQPEVEQLCTNRKAVSAGAHRLSRLRRIVVVSLIIYRQSPIFSLVTNTQLSSLNANIIT